MNKSDFNKWYRENIEVMAKLGVFHPESQSGKTVHLAVASVRPEIQMLNERINRLEQMIQNMDRTPEEIKSQLKEPVKQIKMAVETLEKQETKPKATKPPVVKAAKEPKKKPVSGGWQINKR